jgi:hypothetical protein
LGTPVAIGLNLNFTHGIFFSSERHDYSRDDENYVKCASSYDDKDKIYGHHRHRFETNDPTRKNLYNKSISFCRSERVNIKVQFSIRVKIRRFDRGRFPRFTDVTNGTRMVKSIDPQRPSRLDISKSVIFPSFNNRSKFESFQVFGKSRRRACGVF